MVTFRLFLLVSILLHAAVITVIKLHRIIPSREIQAAQTVKIRIVDQPAQSAKKPSSPPSDGKSALAPKTKTSDRKPLPVSEKNKDSAAVTQFDGKEKGGTIAGYSDLFPSRNAPLATGGSQKSSSDTGAGYDPEGESFSFEMQARNLARIEAFARELAEMISIPDTVKQLEQSGKATLRFSRKNGRWKVVSVTGDPYFRAIIYEVLAGLPTASHAYHLLNETGYDSVRIYLSFATVSSLDLTAKPVTTKTNNNQVYIVMTNAVTSQAWKLAMPIDNEHTNDTVGLNLLGAGSVIYDAVTSSGSAEDMDTRRLRLSPAFLRPIGR